jgi:hypothetical protein
MKNRSILLIVGLIALLVWSTDFSKASEMPKFNSKQLAQKADVIFIGKVIQIDSIEVVNKKYGNVVVLPRAWIKYKITFEVVETFKGGALGNIVTYFANNHESVAFWHYQELNLWKIGNLLLLHVFVDQNSGETTLYHTPFEIKDKRIIDFNIALPEYRELIKRSESKD